MRRLVERAPGAAGPGGELAVRISPTSASGNRFGPGVDLLAVSTDGGETWDVRDAPGERSWEGGEQDSVSVPRWVEPVAWDREGRLYAWLSEGSELRTTPPLSVDAWRTDDGTKNRDPAGEYFPVVFLQNEDLGAVLPIQDSAEGNGFVWLRISR